MYSVTWWPLWFDTTFSWLWFGLSSVGAILLGQEKMSMANGQTGGTPEWKSTKSSDKPPCSPCISMERIQNYTGIVGIAGGDWCMHFWGISHQTMVGQDRNKLNHPFNEAPLFTCGTYLVPSEKSTLLFLNLRACATDHSTIPLYNYTLSIFYRSHREKRLELHLIFTWKLWLKGDSCILGIFLDLTFSYPKLSFPRVTLLSQT